MDEIGVFTPEQSRLLWQDFLKRKQANSQLQANYPQRRPIDEPSPHRVFVRNDSGETCPAYGCMQVTGVAIVGGQTVVTCTKPTTTAGEYLFNSPYPIADGENGWAYKFGVVIALGNGTPPTAPNVIYQPVVSTWTIEEGGSLFTVFGEHNVIADAVVGRFTGGTGGTHEIWFEIISVYCPSETETILTVNPTWYTGGCTAAIPGADSYGYVEVYDVCSILDYYTATWLDGSVDGITKHGRATYMYPRTGTCTPKWLVDTICESPECA